MDPFALIFYAAVCGALSWLAPNLGGATLRMGVGAVVGILAAMLLPIVRGMIGG